MAAWAGRPRNGNAGRSRRRYVRGADSAATVCAGFVGRQLVFPSAPLPALAVCAARLFAPP